MADGSGVAVDKSILAFLNGISKRLYFKEEDITDEFLREDVLGGISGEGEWEIFPAAFPNPTSLIQPAFDSITLEHGLTIHIAQLVCTN